MTIVQSILSFAVSEEIVEYNAAAGVTKPRYKPAREPHMFLPIEVEQIRAKLELRERTLVSVLASSGPRPEEVVCRLAWGDVGEHPIRYVDTKRHRTRHTPCSSRSRRISTDGSSPREGRRASAPYFRPTTAASGAQDDWRNRRKRTWSANPRGRGATARTAPLRARVARRRELARETYAQATSRSACTRGPRSRRSLERSVRASGCSSRLRPCDRELGRKTDPRGTVHPGCSQKQWTENGRDGSWRLSRK